MASRELGYRRIVILLVSLIVVPTALLLTVGAVMLFLGELQANLLMGILVVSFSGASVTGVIQADHVIINGRVVGPVHAHELLELQPKANIEGDVSYKGLEMHQGALIAGRLIPLVGAGEKPTLKLAANND